jgi:hypothetical protein
MRQGVGVRTSSDRFRADSNPSDLRTRIGSLSQHQPNFKLIKTFALGDKTYDQYSHLGFICRTMEYDETHNIQQNHARKT